MTTNSIEAVNIGKKYLDFTLENVSFTLPQGCIMGFIGQNGAGKTTVIKRLLGLTSGQGKAVLLGKENGGQDLETKQQIGVLLDGSFFSELLRPRDIDAVLKRIYKRWDSSLYRQYLEQFEIPQKKLINQLSKGMKTKIRLAAAMSCRPRLLILDEPASGLDPVARSQLMDIFQQFIQDEQNSIFLSTHITADLEKIADYITFLHKGRLIFSEEKDLLLEQYGLAKGEPAWLEALGDLVISHKEGRYSAQALVRDREQAARLCPGLVIDRPSLDDIMVFFAKGEQE
ncbi:MAG: ABC transporter ATP-binding protein [Clostridiaceae bacterium]|jgi:ABC-2 type transport system ATP-binding protein|nr:ABC transporter ATP-binding protein [Clostridiaceae bacterium]